MVEIATKSHGASSSLLYDIHHIIRSVLHLIREEQCIAAECETHIALSSFFYA